MIIFRYLSKEIATAVFATTLVLLIIFVSNQFVHYLNDAASGKITVSAVMVVTGVQIPMLLGYMLPLGLFLGILLTFGRMYVDHEMIVLFSCGVSKVRIVKMVMAVAICFTLIDGWLMLIVEPDMFRYRTEVVVHSVESATLQKVLPGRFQPLGNDNRVLYAGEVGKKRQKYGDIFVAIRNNPGDEPSVSNQWDILTASSVRELTIPGNGIFFAFDNGTRYTGAPGAKQYEVLNFGHYWARLPVPKVSLSGRYSAMPTGALIKLYSHDRLAVAELQWRLVIVFSTLIFALLAIPLSEVNPRKGKFAQLLPAILIYVAYANMMFVGKSWIQQGQINLAFGLWWILAVLLALTLILYLYQSRRRSLLRWLRLKKTVTP